MLADKHSLVRFLYATSIFCSLCVNYGMTMITDGSAVFKQSIPAQSSFAHRPQTSTVFDSSQ